MPYREEKWDRLSKSTREALDGFRATRDEINRTTAEFLKIDVETALTFSKIAMQSFNVEKKQRNCKNARKGYETIFRLMHKLDLGQDDAHYLSHQLEQLKSNLQSLGEVF
jgi:hypothetical protein